MNPFALINQTKVSGVSALFKEVQQAAEKQIGELQS